MWPVATKAVFSSSCPLPPVSGEAVMGAPCCWGPHPWAFSNGDASLLLTDSAANTVQASSLSSDLTRGDRFASRSRKFKTASSPSKAFTSSNDII